jgi:hypothetical protein
MVDKMVKVFSKKVGVTSDSLDLEKNLLDSQERHRKKKRKENTT